MTNSLVSFPDPTEGLGTRLPSDLIYLTNCLQVSATLELSSAAMDNASYFLTVVMGLKIALMAVMR